MSLSAEQLLRQALQLSTLDRAVLADGLIESLGTPEPRYDALWFKEAESRMAAYRAGELGAIDADEVFAELGRKA